MKQLLYLTIAFLFTSTYAQQLDSKDTSTDLEILLVGTFHFQNYHPENNQDVAQTDVLDVLSPKIQKELAYITDQIAAFAPDKIFFEYPFAKQARLDSIYNSFDQNYTIEKHRSEDYQLAFRTAKKLNHQKIYGCDYRDAQFPFKEMISEMKKAKQNELIDQFMGELKSWENEYNVMIRQHQSLKHALLYLNNDENRNRDVNFYSNLAIQGGTTDQFSGVTIASEWYRRNLMMWSYIQKRIETGKDKKIMILLGSSHIAILKQFINLNPKWKTVALKTLLDN